ncbi:probable 6-phosphogluconolactonase 4, chloroplastic [Elaeis guineensis]|uniref:6-phosphogluconolactonase n=1 Tax=Elaeis guineensis var. tenera TaxID=51953 RepID=A0A6I9SJX1_ELAGV|nr:probable 6-phosphogluconolactonase 4, chloroplastic [Elaeis guineensis]
MRSSAVSPCPAVLPSHRWPRLPPARRLPAILRPLVPARSLLAVRKISLLAPKPLRPCRRPISAMASEAISTTAVAKGKQELLVFESEEELAVSLAKYTAELSEKFARERGAFTVVLSGGSLIKSLRKLVEPPYLESVDWTKWHVFWVDERVVPKDHADSNYKLAYDGFLCKVPIPPGQVYAINDSLSAEGAAGDYETCLKQLVKTGVVAVSSTTGFPKFDLMLLGMGPDGHVASLFPGHPLLNENQRWVTFIKHSPKPPPERITFTFPVINSSAYVALVVTGAGKAGAVHKALGSGQSSSDMLPVEMVSLKDGKFSWFTDKAAVSLLQDRASL